MDPWLQIHGQQVDPLPEDSVDSVEIWSGGVFFFLHLWIFIADWKLFSLKLVDDQYHFIEHLNHKVAKMRKLLFQMEDMDSFCGGMLGMLKILEWARALLYQQPRDPRGHGFSGQRNAEVSAASTAVAVGREAIKGQGWIQMLLGYIQTHQHQLGRNLIIQDFHVCQIDDLWFSSSHAPVRSFSAVKFFRNQSYGEISTAGSWGTGAFFEEQIATTGRLCAKLSHHPSTRNFQQKGLFHFLFFRFFSLQFPLHHHLRGESGRNPWQVVLISVPITLPECMNRCTSCTSLARSSERLERVKYRWLSQGCVVTWICGEVQKMLLVDFGSYLVHIGSIYVWKIFKV